MMNRSGRAGSIEFMVRDIFKTEADSLEVELDDSAGIYVPPSRKDLILVIRRSDDADGDRRIIGSGRRTGAFGLWANVGLFA